MSFEQQEPEAPWFSALLELRAECEMHRQIWLRTGSAEARQLWWETAALMKNMRGALGHFETFDTRLYESLAMWTKDADTTT